MSKRALLNLDYALIQGMYWMFYAVAGMFVSVYMLGKGYTNTSIGMVIAIGNIMAVFFQTVIANVTDKNERIGNITVIKVMLVALFVLTAGILAIGRMSMILTVVYTALIVVHTALHPFVNALSFTLGESGEYVSFGIGRSAGSFSAAVLGLAMGYLVTDFGVDVIPFSGLVILIVMEIVVIVTGHHYRKMCGVKSLRQESESNEDGGRIHGDGQICGQEQEPIGFPEFIGKNFYFMILSVGVVALFFGNVVLENFTIQIVESIGGNTEQLGIVIFVMAMLEMPAMLLFDRLKARFSYVLLIRVSAVFFAIKIIMTYMAGTMEVLYVAQINQVLGYGLMFPAMVGFIDSIMSKGEAVRGQAVFTAAITVGNVLGCVFGGRILDVSTAKTLLFISSAITVTGAVIICFIVNKIKSTK